MIKAWWDIRIVDKNNVKIAEDRIPARSFLANLVRMLQGLMKAIGGATANTYNVTIASASVKAQDGSTQSAWTEWYAGSYFYGGGTPMACLAGDNDSSYGIVVGSGSTAVGIDDYKLASQITHGTGAGQLDYDTSSTEDVVIDTSVSPPVARFKLIRSFRNLSGGDVAIREVGIIARSYWKDSGGARQNLKYLIARDVLPTAYTVPNGGSATVVLTVEVTLG